MRLLTALLMLALVSGCVDKSSEVVYDNAVVPEYSPVVELAKQDLAGRLNISIEEIMLAKQEKVDWSDTSLGFPEEGMFYAQVITPGFRIILKADNKLYEYHSDYKRVAGPKEINS